MKLSLIGVVVIVVGCAPLPARVAPPSRTEEPAPIEHAPDPDSPAPAAATRTVEVGGVALDIPADATPGLDTMEHPEVLIATFALPGDEVLSVSLQRENPKEYCENHLRVERKILAEDGGHVEADDVRWEAGSAVVSTSRRDLGRAGVDFVGVTTVAVCLPDAAFASLMLAVPNREPSAHDRDRIVAVARSLRPRI